MTEPATGTDYLIQLHRVSKTFRDFWGRPKVEAVRDVTFGVPRGSIFGLLGPNGAGKSTVMKMILGHLYPTAGQMRVFGLPPTDVETKKRLGYLPERAYLYRNLTPVETLRFFGEVLELPKAEIKTRTDQLLAMVGLDKSRDRLVGEFSHGMTRRMGLAQALLNDPDLLLLDEPTAGLDPLGCREVKNLIHTLAQRGKTVVLTSHLLADVEDLCDQILVMYGGTVLEHGETRSLLADQTVLQVRCPTLSEQGMAELREVLARHGDAAKVEYSSPTRSLETYFVDIVERASGERDTAGAQLGKGVASYLSAGATPPPPPPTATPAKSAPPPATPVPTAPAQATAPVPPVPPATPVPKPEAPAAAASTPPPAPRPAPPPPEPAKAAAAPPPAPAKPAPEPAQPKPAETQPDAVGDMIRSGRKSGTAPDAPAAPKTPDADKPDDDDDMDSDYLNSLL